MKTTFFSAAFVLAASQLVAQIAPQVSAPVLAPADYTTPPSSKPAANYGKLPLSFEANQGQTDPQVKFLSRGQGYSLFLTDAAAVLALTRREDPTVSISANPHKRPCGTSPSDKFVISTGAKRSGETCVSSALPHSTNRPSNQTKTDMIRMELVGAAPNLKVTGADQLPGTANYFIGNDPAKWHSNVSTYSKVKYTAVYPGVDLVYYGNQRQLEYDFIVAPGADPKPVKLYFAGAEKLKLNPNGDLEIIAKEGQIAFHKPVVYQTKDGQREPIEGHFTLLANNTIGFQLGEYDQSRELVIDPTLAYSTYLGGSYDDYSTGIAIDNAGNAYLSGIAGSLDFPVTDDAFQTLRPYSGNLGFVAKMNSTGTALVYATYLGGSGPDTVKYIAVDGGGNAYVSGYTASLDFPVTAGAFQTKFTMKHNPLSYIAKINSTGNALVYSTFLGGSKGPDLIYGLAVNATGNAYVAGSACSTDFPVTSGAFITKNRSTADGVCFVSRLNAAGSALIYSTFLSSKTENDPAACGGIAVDEYDKAYVTGATISKSFPVTSGAFQTSTSPYRTYAAFVTKFNATGSGLIYSTYLGGSDGGLTAGVGIVLDPARNVYTFGETTSQNFPTTKGAYQTGFPSKDWIAYYVTKLDPTGSFPVYSTYFGSSDSRVHSIAVDGFGHVFLAGDTTNATFPIVAGAAQRVYRGNSDGFLTRLNIDGSALGYSTYFGGEGAEDVLVAVDNAGSAYLAGSTSSRSLIVTKGAYQTTNKGAIFEPYQQQGENAFVAKFAFSDAAYTSTQISTGSNLQTVGSTLTFTASVAPVSGTWTPTGDVSFRIDGSPYIHVPLDSSGNATYSTNSLTVGQHTITAAYLGTSGYDVASDGYAPSSASLIQTVTSH